MTLTRPELIGRAPERARITRAYEEGIARIAILGEAGVGKSALANDTVERLKSKRALVGVGRHGSGETGAGPLMRAMQEMVAAALEELYEPSVGLAQLRDSMGVAKSVFDQIVNRHDAETESIKGADALAVQLELVLELTFKWLSGFGLPLVLMLDDWDRASLEVGSLYLRIANFVPETRVCLIVTGRSWPEFAEQTGPDLDVIHLSGLEPSARLALFKQTLGEHVGQSIDGHVPPTATKPLDIIQRAAAVAVELAGGKSVGDPETIAAALQDDLASFILKQLTQLPQDARNIVFLAALFADNVELVVLCIASGYEQSEFDRAIALLAKARMISLTGPSMRFPHETIKAAISEYSASTEISDLTAGAQKRLLPFCSKRPGCQSALMSLLAAHPPQSVDPSLVAPLRRGVQMALRFLDTHSAARLASLALEMEGGLGKASFETLRLFASTSFIVGEHDLTSQSAAQLRLLAQTRSEVSFAYALSAATARSVGDSHAAIQWSLQGYKLLGWAVPDSPTLVSTLFNILWTNVAGDFARALPLPDTPPDLDIVALSATTSTIFFEYGTLHVVSLARRFALSRATRRTHGGLSAALFLATFMGRHKLASQLGDKILADGVVNQPFWPPSAYRAHTFGRLWIHTARNFSGHFDTLHAKALAEGDLLVSAWTLRTKAHLVWRYGGPLLEVEHLAQAARRFATRVGNQTSSSAAAQIWLAARLLQGHEADPTIKIDPYCPHTLDTGLLTWTSYHNLRGAFDETLKIMTSLPRKLAMSLSSHPGVREFQFHRAIAMLICEKRSWPEDIRGIRRAAKVNPLDNGARILILRALIARNRGRWQLAYDLMLAGAQKSNALQRPHEASLAYVLAAELAVWLADSTAENRNFEQARRAWAAWGADPKSHAKFKDNIIVPETGKLNDITLRLEQSERESRAKSRLLALVGHELRTPLQAISGAIDLIQAQTGQTHDLSIVTASIDRLSAMVDDLSDVTALEVDELTVHPRVFSLTTFLQNLIATHSGPLKAAHMTLSLEAPSDNQIWLIGDDKRLQQVLDNLLNNARKYGAGDVLVCVTHQYDQWTFEVCDEGVGLTPDQAVRIFEPFVRGASAGVAVGHGIGLWLARKLAERMQGQLVLAHANSGSKGARFVLTLPMQRAAPKQAEAVKLIAGPKRIILMEDEPLSRDVLYRLLALEGHDVVTFASGQAALQAPADTLIEFDYAFIDFNMPGLNGLETARCLRALKAKRPLNIILMTAQLRDEIIKAQANGDVDTIIQKPISLDTLRKLLGTTRDPIACSLFPMLDANAGRYLSKYCQALVSSHRKHDWEALERDAHKLAGAAMTYQLNDLANAALELETMARTKHFDQSGAIIAQIQIAYDAIELSA